MAAAAAAGSQILFVPGCTLACGLHERARLMVVPLGVRLPPGVIRLAASSPSTARTSRGRLHATALACVSTASTRPGALLRASTIGCASPYVPPSGAGSTLRAAKQAFLAPGPKPPSSRRSKTVAHVPATGAGDQANVPEENDYTANVKDDGALARTPKDDNDGARAHLMVVPLGARLPPSSPSTVRTSRGRLHATALACVSTASTRPGVLLRASTIGCASPYVPTSGARSTLRSADQAFLAPAPKPPSSRRSKTVAHVQATGGGDQAHVPEENDYTANVKDDGALARTSKDDNDGARARAYKDESGGVFKDVQNVADAKENNGSVDPKENVGAGPKEDDGGADAKQNRGVFKDYPKIWMYADMKQSAPGFARFWRDVGSYPRSGRSRDEGTLQGPVDPSIILGEVDKFLLDYDPVENMCGLAAVTHDEVILNEWKDAMCDASSLLHQAIWRGPLLAKHATELVLIGRAFGVVSKEAQLGFLQTRSIWKAIHGLKSMANVFLGQHAGYFPPDDSITATTYCSETVYFRMIGMDEKEYFWQLLDYYKAGFDCISSQMSGLFIDGD